MCRAPALSAPVHQSTLSQLLFIPAAVPYQPALSVHLPSSIQPVTVTPSPLVTYTPASNDPEYPSIQHLTVPSQTSYATVSQFYQHQVFPAVAPSASVPYRPHHEKFIEGPSFPYPTRKDETY